MKGGCGHGVPPPAERKDTVTACSFQFHFPRNAPRLGGRAPSPVLVQGICTESAINGLSGRTWTDGASVPPVVDPGN